MGVGHGIAFEAADSKETRVERTAIASDEATQVVAIIGTGLIGASLGLAARSAGRRVRGYDLDPNKAARALLLGALDEPAPTVADAVAGAAIVIVATPVGSIAETALAALDAGASVVTDVGSVKAPVVGEITRLRPDGSARFVGGHPMAGSEQDGPDGARADLFVGATWVLTPADNTDTAALAAVRELVTAVGGQPVEVAPGDHDTLVALVSHVPQLAATTLMDVAVSAGTQHDTLLRLAAGGFRDMTRIAAGHAAIWPDICMANRDAILAAMDAYVAALGDVRAIVAAGDRAALLDLLERARAARRNLPVGTPSSQSLVELRIPIPDRPGVLAEVTALAGSLNINIHNVEIGHSMEGGGGVLVLVVAEHHAMPLESALNERGYRWSQLSVS